MIELKTIDLTKLINIINKYKIDISLYFKDDISNVSEQSKPIIQNIVDIKQNIIKIRKKKPIPKTIRSLVWNKFIGEANGIGECYVCSSKLSSQHFECGHIVAEVDGGDCTIDNLRPICSLCNRSIGSKNMDDFKKIYLKN